MSSLFSLLAAAVFTILGARAGDNVGAIFCAFIALYNIEPVIRKLTRVEWAEQILARTEVRTEADDEASVSVRETMTSAAKRHFERGARAAFDYASRELDRMSRDTLMSIALQDGMRNGASWCRDWARNLPNVILPGEDVG